MMQWGMCCTDADVMFRKHFMCLIFSPFWYFLTYLIMEAYGSEADELHPLFWLPKSEIDNQIENLMCSSQVVLVPNS